MQVSIVTMTIIIVIIIIILVVMFCFPTLCHLSFFRALGFGEGLARTGSAYGKVVFFLIVCLDALKIQLFETVTNPTCNWKMIGLIR